MRKPQIRPTKGIWKRYGISNLDSCTEVRYAKEKEDPSGTGAGKVSS